MNPSLSSVESKTPEPCKRNKYFCIHNRSKYTCNECGGSSLCIHNRRKNHCKDCVVGVVETSNLGKKRKHDQSCSGGSGVCQHGRIKSQCKDCGGSGVCHHGRRKRQCKKFNYFKTCHLCISKHALQKEQIISYNRNKNILRESNLLEDIEIRSDLVLLGNKMLLKLQ